MQSSAMGTKVRTEMLYLDMPLAHIALPCPVCNWPVKMELMIRNTMLVHHGGTPLLSADVYVVSKSHSCEN